MLYEKFWGELAIATKIHLVGIIMLLVVLGYVLAPLIIQIISPDYYMYDKFIKDLRQVVLFILVIRRIYKEKLNKRILKKFGLNLIIRTRSFRLIYAFIVDNLLVESICMICYTIL